MKKALVAGAASFVLAAMPVIGVFAVEGDPAAVEDTLTVTVAGSCAFTRTTGTGQYTQAMQANQLKTDFGTSTFTAACNNGTGYTISAVFTSLDHSVDASHGQSITYSATTPTAGSGTWTAAVSGGDNLAASNAVLANTNTQDPAAGSTYTVDYKVSTHSTQGAGTYQGTATYTLAQKS